MIKCKNCQKEMKGAHPNKSFCSNKGRGNCKDAYNNKRAQKKRYLSAEFDDEHGHMFSAGYFGHGQD